MKIIFMGTPEFAIPSLKILLDNNYEIPLVVSAPDKERGRGKNVSFTPVKEFSLKNGLQVATPVSLRDDEFINNLKDVDADLFIVVAFRILPKEVYTLPKLGSFNLHGSLLPKYRGAAPIQWAIINGEEETGVTTFFLEDKVDTGNIILQEKLNINADEDLGIVLDKMMMLGAEAVLKTVKLIEAGNYTLQKQNDLNATPAPKINKETCRIDWNKSSAQIHNLVRGLSPYPCAFFEWKGKSYKVFKTELIESDEREMENSLNSNSQFSTFKLPDGKQGSQLIAKTGNGIIKILELQPEGRKRMTAEEFLRGYTLI